MRALILFLLAGGGALHAQTPFIFYRGIVNAASSMAAGLPAGGVARGSIFSIYGRNLGPAASPPLTFPLQNVLGGVAITVAQGNTVVNAIPVYVGPGQINAIMPSNAPTGMVNLRVEINNAFSNRAPVRVVNSSFGVFTVAGTGSGPGIVQNFISQANQPVNGLTTAAQPGQFATLWGTGLGPIGAPDNLAPPVASLPTQTEVFVGGRAAPISYNGRSGCCAGTDQIVFQIPPDAPAGCWVPVYVRTEGYLVSNFVTMAIGANAAACAEASNPLATALISGGRTAMVLAARFALRQDIAVAAPADASSDLLGGFLAQEPSGPYNFNPAFSLPPPGTCTVYNSIGNFPREAPLLPGMAPAQPLRAGAVAFTGEAGARNLRDTPFAGIVAAYLGGAFPRIGQLANTLFLNPGAFTLSGGGGPDIGAFQAQVNVPQPFAWTNRDQITDVTRTQGLTVTWSGVADGHAVFVAGGGADLPANATSTFLCIAAPGDNRLTVPPAVLANIAPTRQRLVQSLGAVYVSQWRLPSPVRFSAPGLDAGLLLSAHAHGKSVRFR
ncbi:MAG: hypothetical protein KIT09_30710 [Bryobacteraceae bacterium]|nr:hypothetical protein [Bryobacteraceae bacterium]